MSVEQVEEDFQPDPELVHRTERAMLSAGAEALTGLISFDNEVPLSETIAMILSASEAIDSAKRSVIPDKDDQTGWHVADTGDVLTSCIYWTLNHDAFDDEVPEDFSASSRGGKLITAIARALQFLDAESELELLADRLKDDDGVFATWASENALRRLRK